MSERSSGDVGLAVMARGQADAPDPSPEEAAVRSLEWTVIVTRRAAEADRRRRLRAVEVEVAEQEQRARRDVERRQRAVRVELARDRFARAGGEQHPTVVDLAAVDLASLHIRQL